MASRQRIVDAARRLVEHSGPATLSMRKLAADLGVAPTAIYWHLGSRRDVLEAVLDDLIAELPPIEPVGATAHDRLRSAAHLLRDLHRDHAATSQLAHELGRDADLSFPAQVAIAREVAGAGLNGDRAADAVRAILHLVGGFLMVEGSFRERAAGAPTTATLWGQRAPADIPVEIREALARPIDSADVFATTLDHLLRSLLDHDSEP